MISWSSSRPAVAIKVFNTSPRIVCTWKHQEEHMSSGQASGHGHPTCIARSEELHYRSLRKKVCKI